MATFGDVACTCFKTFNNVACTCNNNDVMSFDVHSFSAEWPLIVRSCYCTEMEPTQQLRNFLIINAKLPISHPTPSGIYIGTMHTMRPVQHAELINGLSHNQKVIVSLKSESLLCSVKWIFTGAVKCLCVTLLWGIRDISCVIIVTKMAQHALIQLRCFTQWTFFLILVYLEEFNKKNFAKDGFWGKWYLDYFPAAKTIIPQSQLCFKWDLPHAPV